MPDSKHDSPSERPKAGALDPPAGGGVEVATSPPSPEFEPVRSLDPVASGGSHLPPGELLAGRFRVVRFLGRGGMGEVYEAHDLELSERVALKAIRPEVANDERALERFRREIHLARQVTHWNVCRTFDVFRHPSSGSIPGSGSLLDPSTTASFQTGQSSPDLIFLSMELLEGETLAARLRRQGRLAAGEALPILTQIAAGLDAAHKAGVVHRDFKSQNVILVRPPASGGAVRAVITDFGLARAVDSGDPVIPESEAAAHPAPDPRSAPDSCLGQFMGSPPYMAPEQVEGKPVTAAADIYALGVVMYEILTGTQPFVADSPLATAVKRLREDPPPPRSRLPELDPRWEAAVLRCLERQPADRFGSALDLAEALGDVPGIPARKPRAWRSWPVVLGGSLAAALLVAVLANYLHPRLASRGRAGAAASLRTRRSIAVLGFKNVTGDPQSAWLSTAVGEMLSTELAADPQLRVSPGEDVARMKIDLGIGDAASLSRETLSRIHRFLGVDAVVVGSYIALGRAGGGEIRLDLHVQNTSSGETTASFYKTGSERSLFQLGTLSGDAVRRMLGLGTADSRTAAGLEASLPADPEAARLYSEGLEKLRAFDGLSARDLLRQAAALDPGHALTHAALAQAWSALGYDAQAGAESRLAYDLSAGLPEGTRLLVEGQYWEGRKEWGKAVEAYQSLFHSYPDDLEAGLRLAQAQADSGHAPTALQTLERLANLAQVGTDTKEDRGRIDLAESMAAKALSDFRREQAAAARAIAKAEASGSRLLEARARLSEGWALANLGDRDRARADYQAARAIFASTGDQAGVARSLNNLAMLDWRQGDVGSARRTYEQSIEIARRIGQDNGVAAALTNLGILEWQQGDFERARRRFEQSAALSTLTGSADRHARALNNLAGVLVDAGKPLEARRTYEQAIASFHSTGDKGGEATALDGLAEVLDDSGQLASSLEKHQAALALFESAGDRNGAAQARIEIADVLLQQGDLAAARSQAGKALDTFISLADRLGQGQALDTLVHVERAGGRLSQARRLNSQAMAVFKEINQQAGMGEEKADQATLEIEGGDLDVGRQTLKDALAAKTRLGERSNAAGIRLLLAELALDEGRPSEAESAARAAGQEFHKEALEAREASAETLLARVLLAEGSVGAARQAVDRARQLLPSSEDRQRFLSWSVAQAEVLAAEGHPASAAQTLTAALASARQSGLLQLGFRIELALGRVEFDSGKTAAGRARLKALARDAQSRGFALIARQASAEESRRDAGQ